MYTDNPTRVGFVMPMADSAFDRIVVECSVEGMEMPFTACVPMDSPSHCPSQYDHPSSFPEEILRVIGYVRTT